MHSVNPLHDLANPFEAETLTYFFGGLSLAMAFEGGPRPSQKAFG